jgi:Arc/MetJ-type ribon-helix-helix transcriptional regulator
MRSETFKYQMIPDGIMGMQINLRLSEQMLVSAKAYAKSNGFDNVQEFIKETMREKLYEKTGISKKELAMVKKLIEASEKKSLYSSEKELFKRLRRKANG